MKSREVADATLYADIGALAGWSIEGTGVTYIRAGGVAGDIVLVIDADAQATGTFARNLNVPGGAYVDVSGTMANGVLYFD
jgi:hypothetical protein